MSEYMDQKQQVVDTIMEYCKERVAKSGNEVEMKTYPTNDGRMKYEFYVGLGADKEVL